MSDENIDTNDITELNESFFQQALLRDNTANNSNLISDDIMSNTNYETDIIAWANQQAWLIRHKKFDLLDLEHIAEEIEDVGKSEQRELASRMAVLIAHLLKWQYQAERQGSSWQRTIKEQRKALAFHLKSVPSLKTRITDADWLDSVWSDAVTLAIKETGLENFPETCPWTVDDILNQDWHP